MRKLVMLCALFAVGSCTCDYSNGVRVGVPYKLSDKGLLIKTTEGSMNLGGARQKKSDDGSAQIVPNTFDFTIRSGDTATRAIIETAIENGSTVRMHYQQVTGMTCATDSGYFVNKVEVIH
jgi:hypothetical protein